MAPGAVQRRFATALLQFAPERAVETFRLGFVFARDDVPVHVEHSAACPWPSRF